MKIYRIAEEALENKPQEYGYNLTSDPRVAVVDWNQVDLYGGKWNESLVRSFLGLKDDAVIYQTLADISDLNESLVEEDNLEEDLSYDWSELQSRRSNPPPIVITRKNNDTIVINDGNHRVKFWRESNKEYIPAWCYDEKITEWIKAHPYYVEKEDSEENGG